jgi:hypothetical protein
VGKKKGKYRFIERDIPLYEGLLRIVIADDLQKVWDFLDFGKTDLPHSLDHYNAITWDEASPGNYIQYAIFRFGAQAHTFAHEAKHLVNRTFRSRGVNLDPWNDEHECYFLDWYVKQFDFCASSKEVKSKKYKQKKV